MVQSWENEEKRYTNTRASKAVTDGIHELDCIAVTGASGAGKSSIIHHAALQLQKEGCEIIPCRFDGTFDLIQYNPSEIKQVFVVDDWCGKATINSNHVSEWKHNLKNISNKLSPNCKLLISCRPNIVCDPQMADLIKEIIKRKFDICSNELRLNRNEKCEMFMNYMGKQLDKYNMETDYQYFPLLCKLASEKKAKDSDAEIVNFFTQPLECIYNDLNEVTEYGDGKMFCTVCLIVLFESFDINWLDNVNNMNSFVVVDDQTELQHKIMKYPGNPKTVKDISRCVRSVILKVCNDCNINLSNERERRSLKSSFTHLEGTYLTKTGEMFSFLHDRIYDVAARVCGDYIPEYLIESSTDEFIRNRFILNKEQINSKDRNDFNKFINVNEYQEKYFQRLVNDLDTISNHSFMINHQLKNSYYRGQFKQFIDCNKDEIQQKIANSSIMDHWDSWVQNGYVELLESLVMMGLECLVFEKTNARESLLRSAIRHQKVEMVKILFKHANIFLPSIEEYIERTMALHCVCDNNHVTVKMIELFLEHNADPNKGDKADKTPFHYICKNKKVTVEMIKLFLKPKADPNKCKNLKETPFSYICNNNKVTVEIIEMFLKYKANPTICDRWDRTPFRYICRNDKGTVEMIELFLKHNADPNISGQLNITSFHYICNNNKVTVEIIEMFLKYKANPTICDRWDRTPFHYICRNDKGTVEMIELFLKYNADPNIRDEYDRTPFHYICEKKNVTVEMIELFLKYNADLNQCDKTNKTPFHYICENYKVTVEMIELFLKHNADPNICDKSYNQTPFHYICQNNKVTVEMIELLLKNNADPNKCDIWNRTPFHYICENDNVTVEIIELFLEHKVDPNKCDKTNKTPFHYICKNKKVTVEMIELFLKHNADPNKCDKRDMTPFHYICDNNNVTDEIIELFLEHKVDPNKCDKRNITPFHYICKNKKVTVKMIELFLKHNADPNKCDKLNKTPFHYICENENETEEMTKLFQKDTSH